MVALKNAAFLSSRRHNLPSRIKLRNNRPVRNVYKWMQQQYDISERAIVTFPVISSYAGDVELAAARPR